MLKAVKGATKMSSAEEGVKRKRNRRQRACIGCNERKVKCDLLKPCGECRKRGADCQYVKRTIDTLTKSALRQVVNRMTIELDIYKKLENYWRNLAESARLGALTPQEESKSALIGEIDFSDKTTVMTLSTLYMFSRYAEMILPQYYVNFDAQTARNYWNLLSAKIHFDLVNDFEDTSYLAEKKTAKIPIKRPYSPFPTHSTRDSMTGDVYTLTKMPQQGANTGTASQQQFGAQQRLSTSKRPDLIIPGYFDQQKSHHHMVDGVLISSSGRQFDSLDDFMRVRVTSPNDLVSLLEYGVAFLTGLFIMEADDIMNHFAVNCRRLLNELIMMRRNELTGDLPVRTINCAIIMSFYYAVIEQWSVLNSILLFAHSLAVDHSLHMTEPVLSSRLYLVLLWYTRTPYERELYMGLCKQYFPSGGDIDFRCKFSYVSSALRSQSATEDCEITQESASEFWKRIEGYLDDCDATFAILEKFGLQPCTLAQFRSLSSLMRAELGPRIGEMDWPVQQALIVQKNFAGLDDIHTLASLCHLKRFCLEMGKNSAQFEYQGKIMTTSHYLVSVLEGISCPPSAVAPEAELRAQTTAISPLSPFVVPTTRLEPYHRYQASNPETPFSQPSSSSVSPRDPVSPSQQPCTYDSESSSSSYTSQGPYQSDHTCDSNMPSISSASSSRNPSYEVP